MPKKFDIQREMDEHPEKFDFGDIPAGISEQAAADAKERAPQWFKDMIARDKAASHSNNPTPQTD